MIKIDSVRRIISKRLGEPDYLMMDIVAPLYWWDSFNYVIDNHFGNGVTLMRRLPINPFDLSDFSCEELLDEKINCDNHMLGIFGSTQEFDTSSKAILLSLCDVLNYYRVKAIETRDSKYIRQIVTHIPYSYNQRCTISLRNTL